jgi:hypothetical protein
MVDGHVSEILPVGVGTSALKFLPSAWQVAMKKFEKGKLPDLIWLYADHDQVNLEKIKEVLSSFPWKEKLNFQLDPRVEVAKNIHNFSPADIGIYALSQQEVGK